MIQAAFNSTIERKRRTNEAQIYTIAKSLAESFQSEFGVSSKELLNNCTI